MLMMMAKKKKKTAEYRLSFADRCRLMPAKLSDLNDNLLWIHDKKCEKCMARNKIRSECEFIGYKNNRLNYICKECNNCALSHQIKQLKSFRFCINFARVTLTSFSCC